MNSASIVFDANDPIVTNTVINTIDSGPPTSGVQSLPVAVSSAIFPVTWTGDDDFGGSGIAHYDVLVSADVGPFQLWLDDTTETSAEFPGMAGHTYAFYSVATDNVGHAQPLPGAAQAVTTVDVTPPILIGMPGDQTGEATGPNGAVVTFVPPTASDNLDSNPDVVCTPASGSTFALGLTTVTCTATDDAGNSSSATFKVTEQDTTPPVIENMPPNQSIEIVGIVGSMVSFALPTTLDSVDQNPAVSCDHLSGQMFPYGTTIMTCMATDASNNSTEKTFSVTVQDSISPTITGVGLVTQRIGKKQQVTGLRILSSEGLSESSAENVDNYSIVPIAKNGRRGQPIQPRTAELDANGQTVTLTIPGALKVNSFFEISVRSGLIDLASNQLDGNADGIAGDDYVGNLGIGTVLTYADRDKDAVTVTLSAGGVMALEFRSGQQFPSLRLEGITTNSVHSGSIRRARRTGDGMTTFASVTPVVGFRNSLPPSFHVGPKIAAAVDELLESDELIGKSLIRGASMSLLRSGLRARDLLSSRA